MNTTDLAAEPRLAHLPPDRSFPLLEGTVGEALRNAAAKWPERKALAWAEPGGPVEYLDYRQLLQEAERVAAWLLERAAPGERIAIWSRNSMEWVLLEYGCALAGMVVASWNPAWTDYECEHGRDLTQPALLFAACDVRGVSVLERAQKLAPGRTYPLEELRELVKDTAIPDAFPALAASDLFLIQFTSGTTGKAKGASLSHRAALNAGWLRSVAAGMDETDVWVNASPLNHMGGAISVVLGAVTTGACYVMMRRFDAGEYLRLMRTCGASRIGGVPTVLISMLQHPDWDPGAVKIRTIGSGGAQVPQPLIERFMSEFDAPVLNVYGQSESPGVSSSLLGDNPTLLAETVGRPAPHVELKICDPKTGETLQVGEIGEVWVRSPMVMDGYFRMPEATAATIMPDGFLRTGDLGSLDADGYLRIQGRARDVIIRGGENIYPAEVEDVLLQHPAVGSVAVVGVPDERFGQLVAAAVQLRDGASVTPEELEAFAATRLAHFKTPRRWMFVESFPLTPSNKIRKVEVEQMFQKSAS
jgi:fatty-acyl-CoA synthase